MAQVVNTHFTKEEMHMANRMPYLSHKGKVKLNHTEGGASLAVQWLGLHASTAGDTCSIPGLRTKVPHIAGCGLNLILAVSFKANICMPFDPTSLPLFPTGKHEYIHQRLEQECSQ